MTLVKKPSIPNVPNSAGPELRAFLEATRETLQTMAGQRGNSLEKAVTFRDLTGIQSELKNIRRGLGDAGIGTSGPQPLTSFEPVPAVLDFAAVGGFTSTTVSWRMVSFKGYQFTRLWRSGTALFEDAAVIMESATSMFVDVVGPKQQFYYWAQHIGSAYRDPRNAAGSDTSPEYPPLLTPPSVKDPKVLEVLGALTLPVSAVTSADYEDIKDQVRGDLVLQLEEINRQFDEAIEQLDSFFAGSGLQDFVGLLAAIDSRISGVANEYVLLAKTLFEAELSLHRERLKRGEDTAFVQRRVVETKTDLRNLAQSFDLVYADFYNPDGFLAAKVIELNQAIAGLGGSVASRFVEIEASFDGKDSTTNARIGRLEQSTSNANEAMALVTRELDAKFEGKDQATNAKIREVELSVATLDSATARRFVELNADFTGLDSTTNARISSLEEATASADFSLATTIDQLDTKYTNKDITTSARIRSVELALSTGEGSWATRAETIEAALKNDRAAVTQIAQAITAPSGSVFAAVGQMISAERQDINGEISSATSAVLDSVRNDEYGIVSRTISSHRVNRPGGGSATLDTLASVAYSVDGAYSALWGVKSVVGPTTAGVSLYNDGDKTSFIVNAQQFAIHQGSGPTLTVPFSFQFAWVNVAGFVWSTTSSDYPPGVTGMGGNSAWSWKQTLILDNAYIKQAAILRLAAKEITAEKIDATGRVRGGLFTGGVIELASVNGVWPIIQAKGSAKTLEIDPNHPSALWFGDNTYASQITYNESSLTPAVAHRGKTQANANFALGGDGSVFIRRDSGGFSCLHNPNSTFFMWFGPTAGATNPTYANAIWYLDNQGRYPLPLVSKRASGTFGAAAGSTNSVVHLAQGGTINVTVELNPSIGEEIYMQHPGQPSLTFSVDCELKRNGVVVNSRSFPLTVMVYEVEPNVCHITGGKSITFDVDLTGISAGEQTFSATAVLDPSGIPLDKRHFFNGYAVAFRTFEVKEF